MISGPLRTILRDLGVLLHVPAAMALVSVPIALLFEERYALYALSATAALSLALGQGLYFAFRRAEEMDVRHAMITAALAWLVIPIIGAIPFLGIALEAGAQGAGSATLLNFRDPLNALFESISGFTTTGLSVSLAPADLPHTLQWWRSFSQWIGGAGVIVVILTVFHPEHDADRLFFSEGRERKAFSDVVEAVRNIWWIYLSFTALGIVSFRLAGIGWWQAVNLAMSGISTGGFSPRNASLAGTPPAAQAVAALLMTLGAVSFAVHYRVLVERRVRLWWQDREVRALLTLVIAGGALLLLENLWYLGRLELGRTLFQWIAAMSTTGFQTVDLNGWSATARILLTCAMIVGGAAGSTAGGLKLWRVLTLARAAGYRVQRVALQPWRIMTHKEIAEGAAPGLSSPNVEAAAILAVLWLAMVGAGALVLIHVGEYPLSAVLMEAASALGNVGLSTGITGPGLPVAGKLGLMILMWAGRLEIIPLFVLIASTAGAIRRFRE